MAEGGYAFSVFTKPWKMPVPELGRHVSALGFDGVEFPVRPGYPVEPDTVEQLPTAAKQLADFGIRICSVAGPTDERSIAACAQAGVPVIRICLNVDDAGYIATETRLLKEYEQLAPVLERYGVTLGIQNHVGNCVGSILGCRRLVERFDPKQFGIVWDPAHCALCGEEPQIAADVAGSHLCMVNLKNAVWQRTNGPEAEVAQWSTYWTDGRNGLASWPRVADVLKQRGYQGVICLCAEYSDGNAVNRLTAGDLAFAKSLLAG